MSSEVMEVRDAAASYAPQAEQDIPPGYKRTEVGVIPEDWEAYVLGALGEFKNGINKDKEEFGQGHPFVNLMDVFGIPQISSSEGLGLVSTSVPERQAYALQAGDILFVRSSVKPEGVGLTTLVKRDLPNTVFSGFLIRFRDNGKLALEFKEYCFWESGFRKRLIAASTVSANTNINQDALKSLYVAFPSSLKEQRAIATALSDVDALITALDRLIAKKRAIKTAAMQQLLTGKTRLPGFTGEWDTKRLGELAEIVSGGTPKSSVPEYWDGGIHWCTPTDITKTRGKYIDLTERTIAAKGLAASSAQLLPPGSILLCTRATIGEMKIAKVPIATNQGFKSLVCKEQVSNEFLYYKLSMEKKRLIEKASGSTFLEISKKDVVELEVKIPDVKEQTAIAQILSDMDAEITALEARRDKTHAIKQGMMQQLLTGRVRLVKPNSKEAA